MFNNNHMLMLYGKTNFVLSPCVACWSCFSQWFRLDVNFVCVCVSLCECVSAPPSMVIMRGVTHYICPAVRGGRKCASEKGKSAGGSWEFRERGEPSWTGGEGVKCAGLILLSQQQYVKVQGFIVADTGWNPFPLVTLVTEKTLCAA